MEPNKCFSDPNYIVDQLTAAKSVIAIFENGHVLTTITIRNEWEIESFPVSLFSHNNDNIDLIVVANVFKTIYETGLYEP